MKSKILELAKARQKEGKKAFLSPDHKLPISRRDFLAAGLRDTAVFVAMPTLLDLLFARTAQAAVFKPATIFLCLDSSGGTGHMRRAFIPVTSTGAMPSSAALNKMGVASGQASTNKYGAAMAVGTGTAGGFQSNLVTAAPNGGITFAPAANSANPSLIQFAAFSAVTRDDSSANLHSPMNLISAYLEMQRQDAYYIQAGMATGGGTNRALFGGNSGGPQAKLKANSWLNVNNSAAVLNAVSFPGVLLKRELAVSALDSAQKMVTNRMNRVAGAQNQALATQQSKGVSANLANAQEGASLTLDPAVDLDASTISILDTGLGNTGENTAFKAALAAAVKGISRPMITVTLGGGDYHTGVTTDEDNFVKRKVTMLRAASNECLKKGITLVSTQITDGGMNTAGAQAFVSDEGRFSVHAVSVTSSSPVVPKKPQLGFVDAATGFATAGSQPFVDNDQILAVALFASMLSASGDANWLQNVRKIIPESVGNVLTDAQLVAMNAFI